MDQKNQGYYRCLYASIWHACILNHETKTIREGPGRDTSRPMGSGRMRRWRSGAGTQPGTFSACGRMCVWYERIWPHITAYPLIQNLKENLWKIMLIQAFVCACLCVCVWYFLNKILFGVFFFRKPFRHLKRHQVIFFPRFPQLLWLFYAFNSKEMCFGFKKNYFLTQKFSLFAKNDKILSQIRVKKN